MDARLRGLCVVVAALLGVCVLPSCDRRDSHGSDEFPPDPPDSLSLDTSFGTAGVATSNPTTDFDGALAIAIDGSFMYVAGHDAVGDRRSRIEKRTLATGALEPAFGTGGVVTIDVGLNEYASGIATDSTSIYVVELVDLGASDRALRIEKRDKVTGSPDATFGGGTGFVLSNPTAGDDGGQTLALDGTSLYVLGWQEVAPADRAWRIEKRSLFNGALDAGFGGGTGAIVVNPSADEDFAFALALDGTSLYAAGYDRIPGPVDLQWRIEKRNLSTGMPELSFGSGAGFITIDPSAGNDQIDDILVTSSALFVCGRDFVPGPTDSRWRFEKRDLTTGALDLTFGGSSGFVISDPDFLDAPVSICGDDESVYMGGIQTDSLGDRSWRIEKRSGDEGALLEFVVINPSSGNDVILNSAVDSEFLYLVGWDSVPGNLQWRFEKRFR